MAGAEYVGSFNDDIAISRTGRRRGEWHHILDGIDALQKGMPTTVRILQEEYGLAINWAEEVFLDYARANGKAPASDGPPEVRVEQLIRAEVDVVWAGVLRWFELERAHTEAAWNTAHGRGRVKRVVPQRSFLTTWQMLPAKPSLVEISLQHKGPGKVLVSIRQTKLSTAAQVASLTKMWGNRLASLARGHSG